MIKRFLIIIIIAILIVFPICVNAQRKAISRQEVINKLSVLKPGNPNRRIEVKDKLFYDFKKEVRVSPAGLTKDSLRHFLVSSGFYDYNFEYFNINLKNIGDLNESYIRLTYPELYELVSDTSYNKVTFCYNETDSGLTIDAIISKNFIEVDDIKEGKVVLGVGYKVEELTYKGTSKVNNIFFTQDSVFSNVICTVNKKAGVEQPIVLDNGKRFRLTFDVSSHKSKYVAIDDSSGNILSVIKIY